MYNAQEVEKEILDFWNKKKIYEKVKKKNAKGKKFYFIDGPPYATGHIHLGTALNKILKDIAMRSRRSQGFSVYDRPGYDTHGVPIEFQVEKEIGSKNKGDIEKYGVKKFIGKCKNFATKYIGVMNSEFKNLGVWMDWDNPYLTLDDGYIDAIWSAFKGADKKGLLYLGKYPVHVCPRCETAVAFNEIEYGKQKDTSVFVKFPLKEGKKRSLIIWTTTPWTLPGNTGVIVGPKIDYQEVEVNSGERWIIAKDLVPELMTKLEGGFTVKNEFKGEKMEGWKYKNPLDKNLKVNVKNGYRVVLSGRYVTTDEGSGLVHCAPGHGKEDYDVGMENGLDVISPIESNGLLSIEAGKYAGKKARHVDSEIIDDLEKDGNLVYSYKYEHDYPLCWRDKEPLLMFSQPQWFLRISAIQKKLLKENEKVEWVPSYMKLKMKAWLEGIGDWPISRDRYWGTPLPIWYDEKSGERVVVGDIDELEKLSGEKIKDIHKPEIDKIEIKSKKTGKKLKRVPGVLDVWFDSGVSSWAALGYPKDKKLFKRYWPADLNIEGTDQFRGWWNSQIILSQILFERKPFEAISVHGLITDLGKKKMSKSIGNITSPQDIIDSFGRDYLRYYFAKFSKGSNFSYDEKEMRDIRKVFTILINIDRFVSQLRKKKGEKRVEDKWILSKFNSLSIGVEDSYNSYKFFEAVNKIEKFVVEDFSRTYIQIVRERADEAYDVISEIQVGLLKLISPVCPFITESLWREMGQKEESVHLASWPKADGKKIDSKLEEEFDLVMKVIEIGLSVRDKEKIGLRWPLGKAEVECNGKLSKDVQEIIGRQLNVKSVLLKPGKKINVKLDLKMTPDLEAEGFAREIARKVQSERKKAGLKKGDLIDLEIGVGNGLKKILEKHLEFLKERTNSKKLIFVDDKIENVFTIKGENIGVKFS
jgi:isoleucyl-tRNA synthetase